jgi:hypothetical protein
VNPSLQHKLFVTEQIAQSGRGPLPDGSTRMWSPITSTLITGHSDAVLVDPPMTTAQAAAVGDWVAASGRNLRQIYVPADTAITGSARSRCCNGFPA